MDKYVDEWMNKLRCVGGCLSSWTVDGCMGGWMRDKRTNKMSSSSSTFPCHSVVPKKVLAYALKSINNCFEVKQTLGSTSFWW